MDKTFGRALDNPGEWFWWMNNTLVIFTLLRVLHESRLLAHLGDEPVSIEALSKACGISPDKLERIAYFLAAEELVELGADGTIAHTPRSRYLQSIMPVIGVCMHALEAGIPMTQALRQDVTPYELRYGKPVFEHLADEPETAQMFGGLMSFLTTLVEQFVFSGHEFKPFDVAVDVGGSHGELLLGLLSRHPAARGVLFDLPEVTNMIAESVRQARHGDRVEIVGGDFFESVPEGDLYLLKMILHDWNDEECARILGSIRRAMRPGGRVAVIDFVLPETPRPHPANSMDIEMMVWATGRERRLSEFEALFEAAGFRFDRVTQNPLGQSVVEAVAA